MARLRRLALLVLAGAAVPAAPAAAVVQGTVVDPARAPWFVTVGGCGGTLVTPQRVLTAGHCVQGLAPADLGGVRAGGATRTYTRWALHPGWRARNGESFLDDVAVVELSAPLPGVPTVTLAGRGDPDPGHAWVLGRGRAYAPGTGHSEAQALDARLRIAPLRSLGDAACAALLHGHRVSSGETFDPRMRCAIDADGRAPLYSGCFGDSGGPLFTGPLGAPVQLGVVSWGGDRCGADHLPSVFADVRRYRRFILDPSPAWAPTHRGTVTVRRAGARLRCRLTAYTPERGAILRYTWRRLAAGRAVTTAASGQVTVGHGRSYTPRRADRHRRVACFVTAAGDGGELTVGVASALFKR